MARAGWSLIEAEAQGAARSRSLRSAPTRSGCRLRTSASSRTTSTGVTSPRPPRPATTIRSTSPSTSRRRRFETGLPRLAEHVLQALGKLVRGQPHALSHTLLDGNAAWPAPLADAARRGVFADEPLVLAMPLALSRTQDDKGNVRWTLFGASHDGPSAPFWRSFADDARFTRFLAWASDRDRPRKAYGSSPMPTRFPPSPARACSETTDRPRAHAPHLPPVRAAPRAGPGGVPREEAAHRPLPRVPRLLRAPRYRQLSTSLPHAMQIPLLHLFPRCEDAYGIRIPQSGWLDEHEPVAQHRTATASSRTSRARTGGSAWRATRRSWATARSPTGSPSRSSRRIPTTSASTASRWRATRRSGRATTRSSSTALARRGERSSMPPR